MKTLHALLFSSVVLATGAMMVGCGGDDNTDNPAKDGGGDVVVTGDGGPGSDGSVVDANDGGPLEFTEFAKELILTQTSDKTIPATTEDKVFVDSHTGAAFPPSFFP